MHLAEGRLPVAHALGWRALAASAVFWSLRGERQTRRDPPASLVIMAAATSLLFAGTLLPLPVPVVGANSPICVTLVLALVVGIRRLVWPTFFVLLLQAVFFARRGLTKLGVNTMTLGRLGPPTTAGALGVISAARCEHGLGSCARMGDTVVLAAALSAPPTTFGAVLLGFAPVPSARPCSVQPRRGRATAGRRHRRHEPGAQKPQ